MDNTTKKYVNLSKYNLNKRKNIIKLKEYDGVIDYLFPAVMTNNLGINATFGFKNKNDPEKRLNIYINVKIYKDNSYTLNDLFSIYEDYNHNPDKFFYYSITKATKERFFKKYKLEPYQDIFSQGFVRFISNEKNITNTGVYKNFTKNMGIYSNFTRAKSRKSRKATRKSRK